MPYLRNARPRLTHEPTEVDLRGLGNEAIFTQSAPYACLTLARCRAWRELGEFLARHDLVAHESRHPDVTHLTCRTRIPGTHKEQAVRLFVAALELHQLQPKAGLFISEVSGLHFELHQAIRGKGGPAVHGPDARVRSWLERPRPLSLEPSISWHLHQAGFEVSREQEVSHLSAGEIDAVFQSFVRSIRKLARDVRAA